MKRLLFLFLIFSATGILRAQSIPQKKALSFSDYDQWKTIEHQMISDDGKWIAYELNPYQGDGRLYINYPKKSKWQVFERGYSAKISSNSDFIAFKIKVQKDTLRKLKFNKVKKEKLPKDSLGIWAFKSKKTYKYKGLKSFNLPVENSSWLAFLIDKKKAKEDTSKTKKAPKKKKKTDKSIPKVYDLVIFNPITEKEHRFNNVSEFNFSRNGNLLGFIQIETDSTTFSKVNVFDTQSETLINVFESNGIAKKVNMDNLGKRSAFIHTKDTTKLKVYSLYTWTIGSFSAQAVIIDTNSLEMPKDWVVSENGRIWFSRDDSKLYFGTALKPEPEKKDSLLKEEKVEVDIWSWKDPYIQPQQKAVLKKEQKRTYLTVYHFSSNTVARLADELIQDTQTVMHGNGQLALGFATKPFLIETNWDYPSYKDVYLINVRTGNKKLVLQKQQSYVGLSPFGKYVFWYNNVERGWYAMNSKTGESKALTKSIPVNFYDEDHDYPSLPGAYMFAGWTKDDKYFLVYDRFDIWQTDPKGVEKPVCLTNGYGRKNNIRFRNIRLDRDKQFIDLQKPLFLSAFNKLNKKAGYYKTNSDVASNPMRLIYQNFYFYNPAKAKKADKIIWQKSSVTEPANLWYGDLNFKRFNKITRINLQQKNYVWPTVELVKWKTFDGREAEGLLYKPDNYDPAKKYPMMVYYYRLSSDNLNRYISPKPSRSVINATFYASNGYLVFIPNIRYEIGHPGKSAVNYIVSGTQALIDKGIAHKGLIGTQGQSWGGYQVAYIITQSNIFAAASAGAPVSNMISAYGGIRWKSGMSRMFQYEKTQSRLGATLWENPKLYLENSPIFYLNKVETPLLIRHDDADGAVPWYQGIEMFMGLRRLQKPVWMLNYNGEPHNLKAKTPDNKDLSIRMMQFFDHYLKGKPMPVWMKSGIPAMEKGKTLGYELAE